MVGDTRPPTVKRNYYTTLYFWKWATARHSKPCAVSQSVCSIISELVGTSASAPVLHSLIIPLADVLAALPMNGVGVYLICIRGCLPLSTVSTVSFGQK